MTPERWEKVNELFHSALAQAPNLLAAFLDQACGNDLQLRREVESLIRSHQQSDGFIDSPAFEIARDLARPDQPQLLAGESIGHYKIVSLLGKGGMGEVYLARDSRLGRKVALKLLPSSLTKDADRVRRFEQEARAASALNHPNILTVHSIEETDGVAFIATEYIEGTTLRQHLDGGRLELNQALDLAIQVASALSAAHQAGITHRDIKPENIMLRPDGYVKVLDVGLAKLTEQKAASSETESRASTRLKTETGMVIGTASYMSPEQAKGEPVDQRSDIFSFGTVFYEMLTGEQPFRRDSDVDTLHAIIHDEPAGQSGLRAKLPTALELVLRRCMEKEVEQRYANGGELVAALKEVLESSRANSWGRDVGGGWRRRWWVTLICLALVVTGVVVVIALKRVMEASSKPTLRGPLGPIRTVPLTAVHGVAGVPRFSPDGNQVAFGWTGEADDNWEIYVKLVDGGAERRLTNNPDADLSPVWSPDGQYLAFTRASKDERAIYRIPILGSPERKLLTTNVPTIAGWGGMIDWSPPGEFIAYSDATAPDRPLGLCLLTVETFATRQLTAPPEGYLGDTQPAFSPDGQMLAFLRFSSDVTDELYVMPTAGGEPRRLTFDNQNIAGVTWAPDGHNIVFASTRGGGLRRLWQIPLGGGDPEPLGIGGDNAFSPTFSRQGQRMAYTNHSWATSMWRADLPVTVGKAARAKKLFSATVWEGVMHISPDGKRIALSSQRSGTGEVWVCDSDGSNLLQLTKLGRQATGSPRWSPDGRSIAFDTRLGDEKSDIFVIGANGGQPRRLTEDPAEDSMPSWSRDGRWIYFASNRTGDDQLWKIPAEGGDAIQVTRHGGSPAFESPDGRYVYFQKGRDVPGLWRLPAASGEEELVLDKLPAGAWGLWAVIGDGVYYCTKASTGEVIEFFRFATRRVTTVASAAQWFTGLDVSPDERWLVYYQQDVGNMNIMLVENFR